MLNTLMIGIVSMAVGIGITAYLAGDVREILGLKKRRPIFTKLQRSGFKIDINSLLFYAFFVFVLFACMFLLWLFLKV